jgi:hypothetical protein
MVLCALLELQAARRRLARRKVLCARLELQAARRRLARRKVLCARLELQAARRRLAHRRRPRRGAPTLVKLLVGVGGLNALRRTQHL